VPAHRKHRTRVAQSVLETTITSADAVARIHYEFQEANGTDVAINIDVMRAPKKSLPKGATRDTPRADALAKLVAEFIANHGEAQP
jgi:hypothetical protein